MDNRRRIYRTIERHVNKLKKNELESFYGENTKIVIRHIDFAITKKSVIIDCVVKLGGEITEDILDPEMADVLIKEVVYFIYPELTVMIQTSWDV